MAEKTTDYTILQSPDQLSEKSTGGYSDDAPTSATTNFNQIKNFLFGNHHTSQSPLFNTESPTYLVTL